MGRGLVKVSTLLEKNRTFSVIPENPPLLSFLYGY